MPAVKAEYLYKMIFFKSLFSTCVVTCGYWNRFTLHWLLCYLFTSSHCIPRNIFLRHYVNYASIRATVLLYRPGSNHRWGKWINIFFEKILKRCLIQNKSGNYCRLHQLTPLRCGPGWCGRVTVLPPSPMPPRGASGPARCGRGTWEPPFKDVTDSGVKINTIYLWKKKKINL